MGRLRGIAPTDIDGLIDYSGNSFVYIEGKSFNTKILKGQQCALEHVIDSHRKAGHDSIAIIFKHEVREGDVIVKDQLVTDIYNGKWIKQTKPVTVLKAIERWEKHCELKGIQL